MIIDWDARAEAEGFNSPMEMFKYYTTQNGTFKGVAIDLNVSERALYRLRKHLNVLQFQPKDILVWPFGYTRFRYFLSDKLKEGMSIRDVWKLLDKKISIQNLYYWKGKLDEDNSKKMLNHSPRYKRRTCTYDCTRDCQADGIF